MVESEYKYRLRDKTSTWGIAINLTISFEKISDNKKRIMFNYDDSVFLTNDEKEIIEEALIYVNNQNKTEDSFNFFIKNVVFNDCDFQKEGLFFATILWATNHFSFKKPSDNYRFNQNTNLYLFDYLEK
jgi:hypothetical protein